MAVGAGGASMYNIDNNGWTPGNDYNSNSLANPSNQDLNAIIEVGGTFFAVGNACVGSSCASNAGVILSSTDGATWTSHTPATTVTTNNLRGIAHGANYVAVGDNGTILTSGDGNTWASHAVTIPLPTIPATTAPLTANLKQVASIGNLIVAVGDAGIIVMSKDAGATWVVQTLPNTPNLVGVTAESLIMGNDVIANIVDGWLGIIPNVQFVAVDSSGNAYATQRSPTNTANTTGLTWSQTIINTGASSLNAIVSSGFGYVAVGNAGTTTSAF